MSGSAAGVIARLGGRLGRAPLAGVFNGAGRAGPRRPIIIVLTGLGIVAAVGIIAQGGRRAPVVSHDARQSAVDALPGGLHSTPEQDALAQLSDDAQAGAALRRGVSYTPPLAPSQLVRSPPDVARTDAVRRGPPRFVARPFRLAIASAVTPTVYTEPLPVQAAPSEDSFSRVTEVAASTSDQQAQQAYSKQIGDLFSQWGNRAPRTDVLIVPPQHDGVSGDPPAAADANDPAMARPVAASSRESAASDSGTVLIPAGRGVYAHPLLQLNSDATSPAVFEADSGPISGDRMLGTFSRENDRLIIHISSIIHQGEAIGADGVVIAPDTMEASVASSVDEHYLTRFVLPAAAAFVSGLGQAIATTSNTASVLSPLGGVTTSENLNFHQQLGVAAGTAASNIGSTLAAEAPKGPTVSLEANVAVGVIFLTNVTSHTGGH